VFGLEMEDVDTEANIIKKGIIFHHLHKCAVIVKEYVTGLEIILESTLYHFL
jgi:hypothetical protein